MPKFLTAAAAAAALLLAACQSLPDGAERPNLAVDEVRMQVVNDVPGFLVLCSVQHHSLTPLPLQSTQIKVFVNGSPAADYLEPTENVELPPNQPLRLSYFVPASQLTETARDSLRYNRMLQLQASVMVHLNFEDDEASGFNPNAVFEGIIAHD